MERISFCCRLLLDPSSEPLKECFLTQSKKSFNMYLSEKKKSEAPDESEATTPKLQADDLINFR